VCVFFLAVFLFSFVDRSIKVTDPLRDSSGCVADFSLSFSLCVVFWLCVGLLCMMVTATLCLD
jgi:hypothetical protein